MGTNGIFSFGEPFVENSPAYFPSLLSSVYFSYIVAPFWSDIDTRLEGTVQYKTYSSASSDEAVVINSVANFINNESGLIVNANWMLVATWSGVHPFPHGDSVEQDRQDPHLRLVRYNKKLFTYDLNSLFLFLYPDQHVPRDNDLQWYQDLLCVYLQL